VIAVKYPLSPEAKFPAALETVRMVLSRDDRLAGEDLLLVGESAGGNLALSTLQEDEEIRRRTRGLVMIYPFLDLTLSGESAEKYKDGYLLTRGLLDWFAKCYLETADRTDPKVSPLLCSSVELPPSLVIVGEFDPLRSDAVRFAESHENSLLHVYPGMIHGFLQLRSICSARDRALKEISAFVNSVKG